MDDDLKERLASLGRTGPLYERETARLFLTHITTLEAKLAEAERALEVSEKALKPFDRIWGAIESVQELDRDAHLVRWMAIQGGAATGGTHLDQDEVYAGMKAEQAVRRALATIKGGNHEG